MSKALTVIRQEVSGIHRFLTDFIYEPVHNNLNKMIGMPISDQAKGYLFHAQLN